MNISLNSSCPSLYPFSYHNGFYCFLKDGGAKKGDVGVMSIGTTPMDPDFLFFKLYAFILLTSTLVPGINYFVVTTHPLHQLQVRKRSSSSCYMIETYNTRHRFPCY